MATRRHYSENWSPIPQKLTARRSQYEPRDEQVRLPKSAERALQPKPLNVPSKWPQDREPSGYSTQCRKDSSQSCEALSEPRVVDVGPLSTWQRSSPAQRMQKRKPSPSIASTRQSEVSIGILDYYMRDQSPAMSSPELPPPTPLINAAGESFDFGTPSPCTQVAKRQASAAPTAQPRAGTRIHSDQPLRALSPPSQPRPEMIVNRGYTLFPAIKEVTPPRQAFTPLTPKESTSPSSFATTTPPETIYRPRKESITSSPIRSRNNSLQTRLPKHRAPIPLRILSSSSSTISTPYHSSSNTRRTASLTPTTAIFSSTGTYHQNHWSDDTTTTTTTTISIPSPYSTIVAPPPPASGGGPGRRASFGSLLRRDSHASHQQHSVCFFGQDDDGDEEEGEAAHMLGRKWAWKKSSWRSSDGWSERESRALRKGVREICDVDEEEEWQRVEGKWWRGWLCGCVGRRRVGEMILPRS